MTLKRFFVFVVCGLLTCAQPVHGQGTAFTYQGQLSGAGGRANGSYDFVFSLYEGPGVTNTAVAGPMTVSNVWVTNGLFTATIDFGPVFDGRPAWLLVGVRTNGASGFTTLLPLQELTAAPYALFSASANSVPGSNIVGTIAPGQIAAPMVTNGQGGVNLTGKFGGDGALLTNVSALSLTPDAGATASNGLFGFLANQYFTNMGVTNFVVPDGAGQMVVELWGAGGGNGYAGGNLLGAGGAYASATLGVHPGDTYTLLIGAHGGEAANPYGGGAGTNNGDGGPGGMGWVCGGGGQATSLFYNGGGNFIMKGVAGGGAGSSLANVGQPGQANGSGAGYGSNATTTGYSSLSSFGGVGGTGAYQGAGGGGGYGGGTGSPFYTVKAGGGGSYGNITISGSGSSAANTNSANYLAGFGGGQQSGMAVVTFQKRLPVATLAESVQASAFIGDGAALTNLLVSNLIGTVSMANLPTNIVTNGEAGVSLAGIFAGDGTALTHLMASNLVGTVSLGHLPGSLVTNGEGGVTLAGAFGGDGGGLTNLNAAQLNGILPGGAFGTAIAYTPTMGDGTHNFTTQQQQGYYIKVGNLVYFDVWLTWSSTGSATAGLALDIGLPVAVAGSQPRAMFTLGYLNGITFSRQLVSGTQGGRAYAQLFDLSSGGSAVTIQVGNCAASGELQLSGVYRWQ